MDNTLVQSGTVIKKEKRGERVNNNFVSSHLAIDALVAVSGLDGEDDGRCWRIFSYHQRVGKWLEHGSIVVHVLNGTYKITIITLLETVLPHDTRI